MIISESVPEEETGNRKTLEALVTRMINHRKEVETVDFFKPLLPQLDLLTDAQIKEEVREADPLYQNSISKEGRKEPSG